MKTLLQAAKTAPSAEYFKGYRAGLRLDVRRDAENSTEKEPGADTGQLAQLVVTALEEGYTSGVEALLSYAVDGDAIYGRFRDGAKVFAYTLKDDEISYWLMRGQGRADSLFLKPILNVARKDDKGSPKANKCVKGTECGISCISANKKCKIVPRSKAKKAIAQAKAIAQDQIPKAKASKPKTSKPSNPTSSKPGTDLTAVQNSVFRSFFDSATSEINKSKLSKKIVGNATIEEQASIKLYTGMLYQQMNQILRGQDANVTTPEAQNAIRFMSDLAAEGLKKMPKHEGVVYRGTSLPAEDQAQYKPGAVVQDAGFVSTSYAKDSAFNGNTQYVIQSKKHGVNVEKLSGAPDEKEILFPPATKFRVLNVENKNGIMTVYMEED